MTEANLLTTPLNEWHRANGAKMVDFSGWDMPVQYKPGILAEHLATRKFGGLFDVSHMGRFRIKGQNRMAFMQHVLSNNAEALEPWQAQYTLIPNDRGGVIDDAYLYRFGQGDYLLVVNAANRQEDWEHFQQQAGNFDQVVLDDCTEQLAMIALQGPLSGRILRELAGRSTLPEPLRNRLGIFQLCGLEVMVARTGYTGEPISFELFLPANECEQIWSSIHDTGKDLGLLPAGLGARDTLRLEACLPLYGHELGTDPDGNEIPAFAHPLAAVAVSFSQRKGDYIGRKALSRQFEQFKILRAGAEPAGSGPLRRLVMPLAVTDRGVARRGDEVYIGPTKVGVVTSGTTTPFWRFEDCGANMQITDQYDRRTIALAYLDAALLPEQRAEVVVRQRRLNAQIVRWHGRSEAPPYFMPIPAGLAKPKPEAAAGKGVDKAVLLLKKSLENHEWRQRRCVNLIPSEMTPSPLVRLLQVTDPVGRYAEHKELAAAFEQEVFYYQGTDFIAWVEERLNQEMADFLGCSLIESRMISGQMANAAVFGALVDYRNRGDRRREAQRIRLAMNNHLGKGGHLSSQPMGALHDYIAKDPVTEQYAAVNFPVCSDNPYRIDVAETAGLLDRIDPEIIIFGKSMVLHPEPVREIRELFDGKHDRPLVMYDMAHVLGLTGPHFQQPFADGADIVTGSTHKTFFGPQRGIIAADFPEDSPHFELWKAIRRRAFPGMVSNHHLGTMLGLLLAAIEMNTFKDDYQRQVIANAKAFARALRHEGLNVEGDPAADFTETHQVLVNVGRSRGIQVARQLEANNIIVNYQALPGDESFTASSGLRMGVSEMTRFGMKESDFQNFASLFAEAGKEGRNLTADVVEFRAGFQAMQYSFDGKAVETLKERLLGTF
jgi:aminomethyltransferase